jgi:ELWxxDGT repeat protein
MVRDLRPGAPGSRIDLGGIMDVAGSAIVSTITGLYRSDGTARGTRLIRSFDQISPLERHAARRGRVLFFGARDRPLEDDALWRTDGTSAGTYRISPRQLGPFGLTRFGRHIFFGASPGPWGPGLDPLPELWMTSGTMASTRRVGSLLDAADLTVLGDRLYFNAQRSALSSRRLFRSDGTVAGTQPVRPRVGPLVHMVKEGGRLWSDITTSEEGSWEADALWVSDGTASGTKLVYGNDGAWVVTGEDWLDCTASGGKLYFAAGPGGPVHDWEETDQEPWASDGTTAGTAEAADIDPEGSSMPREFTTLGAAVIFSANDHGARGRELWRLDP